MPRIRIRYNSPMFVVALELDSTHTLRSIASKRLCADDNDFSFNVGDFNGGKER